MGKEVSRSIPSLDMAPSMIEDTFFRPVAAKRHRQDTAFAAACRALWPSRHNYGLAAFAGRPKRTARAWISGDRRPPVSVLLAVQSLLQTQSASMATIAAFLASEAQTRKREPLRRSGWAEVRERDGAGSQPRDARWRGGRVTRWG